MFGAHVGAIAELGGAPPHTPGHGGPWAPNMPTQHYGQLGIVLVGTTTVGVGTKAPQWAQVAKPGKNQPNWQPNLEPTGWQA